MSLLVWEAAEWKGFVKYYCLIPSAIKGSLKTLELCKWFAKQWAEWTVLLFILFTPNLQISTCSHKDWQALRWLFMVTTATTKILSRGTWSWQEDNSTCASLWHGKNSAAKAGLAALGTFLLRSTNSVLLLRSSQLWPLLPRSEYSSMSSAVKRFKLSDPVTAYFMWWENGREAWWSQI